MTFIDLYQNYIFYILWLISLLLIMFIFLNIKTIVKQFNGIKRKIWIILFGIFLFGFILRVFVFPHVHLMYIDEPQYLEIAKNINQKQEPVICQYKDYDFEDCNVAPKAPGWPFLISILLLIFGLNNYYALYFSSILGSISTILIFLFTYLIFKNQKIALGSSFFLALTPLYILWSNSAETNNPSLFFVLLTMISFLIYIKSREKSIFILTSLILIFTILVRFENIILVVIFFLAYVKFSKLPRSSFFRLINLYYPSIVIIMLIAMISIESFFIGFFKPIFSRFIIDFYYLNFSHFLKSISFNFIYLPTAALSLFFIDKKVKNKFIFLFISLIFFLILYLPISAESRMALTPGIFVIILSAYSLEKMCSLFKKYQTASRIFFILIFLIIFGLNLKLSYENTYAEYNNNLLETESVMQIKNKISENCYVIAEFPVVLTSISDIKGLVTRDVLLNSKIIDNLFDKGECIYYFYDGYCADRTISPPRDSRNKCQKMLRTFDMVKEKTFKRERTEYFLFRVDGRS